MDAYYITYLLKKSGNSMTDVARSIGVSQSSVWQVIHRKRPSPRIRQAIATAVGRPISELWPEKQPQSEEVA